MTVTNDDRFPPVGTEQPTDKVPLDLSVLARAASNSSGTEQAQTSSDPEPVKPRDKPPRQASPSGPPGRSQQSQAKPRPQSAKNQKTGSPSTFVRDDETTDYHPGILVKPLRDLYVTVGTLVLPFNKAVGTSFIQNAEACAKSLDNAAKTDKQIRKVLMLLVQGSVWGEVILAHMPIMLALAVTLVPSVRASFNGVQSEGGAETINPVSNGYTR